MAATSAARSRLPTTRLQGRQRTRSGWWMGLLVAIITNVTIIVVLVRVSHLHHDLPPAPQAVQRITTVEPPQSENEPEPIAEPQEEFPEAPPQLTLSLPALDLAAPVSDSLFSLPNLPVSDQPLELPQSLPAFSAVASDAATGFAAPGIANASLTFDEPPVLLSGFDLQRFYPRQARRRGVEGETTLRFEIAADGTIDRATVVSSTPTGVFDQAAERLARSLRFTPAKRAGAAVASHFVQHISWKLER